MTRPQPITPSCYSLRLGPVNAFLLAIPGALTLVDCGLPGNADRIEQGLQCLGYSYNDLRHILITHGHPDHAGSLSEIQARSPQAQTSMHPLEAQLVRAGVGLHPDRPLRPAPGLHNYILYQAIRVRTPARIPPARVDREVHDGQHLAIGEGLTVIATPGHTRGHLSFLWHAHGGVLFVGDAASSLFGPGYSICYEDFPAGQRTLERIAQLPFQVACFGHGRPILRDADRRWSSAFEQVPTQDVVAAPEPLCHLPPPAAHVPPLSFREEVRLG